MSTPAATHNLPCGIEYFNLEILVSRHVIYQKYYYKLETKHILL